MMFFAILLRCSRLANFMTILPLLPTLLIKTGASSITLEIPEKLESAVVVDSQVKSVDVANRFEKKENRYETKGFDKALTRAEIEIKAAAGNIVIK